MILTSYLRLLSILGPRNILTIFDPKIIRMFCQVPNNLFIFIYYITPTPVYFETFSGFVDSYPDLSKSSLLMVLLLTIIVNL